MPTIRRKKKRISICQIRGTNGDEIKGYITSVGYGVSVGDIVSTQVNFTGSDFLQVVSL